MSRVSFCFLSATVVAGSALAATVNVVSGNGTVGNPDSQIHFLGGPSSTDFGPLTAANFTSAQTGPFADIIAPNGAWVPASAIPGALWIGDNPGAAGGGSTDLYAISFNIPTAFSSASFSIKYSVDNQLGGTNPGLFLNGLALGITPGVGTFTSTFTYSQTNVQSLLNVGTNWLYIDAENGGGPAGLLFAATITTVDSAGGVPEPGTLGLIGLGGIALAGFRRIFR